MRHSAWWHDNRWIILQVGLFAVCCILVIWIRAIVAADTLSDLAAVALQVGTFLAVLGAALGGIMAAYRAKKVPERLILRIVPIGLLLVAATFVRASYADVSVALHALTTKADDSDTVVALGPNGQDVRLSGSLTEGAAHKLADLLDAHREVKRIHLTSDGGLVDEGEALAKVIAKYRLTTFVSDYCVSACTLAFLGGRERLVMEDARLGFHAPYEEGLFNQTFAGDNSAERAAYLKSGVASDFIDQAFKVMPDDIWTPDADRLLSAHVVTGIVDRYRFPDSNLDGNATKAGARATVLRNFPLARALAGWKPSSVDVIAAWYLDAYTQGLSEGETVDGITGILGDAASLAMADADDETLVGLGRFIKTAMEAEDADEDCAALGAKASLIEAESVLNQEDDGADTLAVTLLSHALKTRQPRSFGPRLQSLPDSATTALSSGHDPCVRMRDLYARVLQMPRHDAATLMRALVSHPPQDTLSALAAISAPLR